MVDKKNNLGNNVHKKSSRFREFLHGTCFIHIKSTLIKAKNNGKFSTWPGFTAELIATHIQKSEGTIF